MKIVPCQFIIQLKEIFTDHIVTWCCIPSHAGCEQIRIHGFIYWITHMNLSTLMGILDTNICLRFHHHALYLSSQKKEYLRTTKWANNKDRKWWYQLSIATRCELNQSTRRNLLGIDRVSLLIFKRPSVPWSRIPKYIHIMWFLKRHSKTKSSMHAKQHDLCQNR